VTSGRGDDAAPARGRAPLHEVAGQNLPTAVAPATSHCA
jgi:hypothetical protein